mgnify:FL=1
MPYGCKIMKVKKMLRYMNYIYQTYINKRMMILLALGFTSGFPFLLVFGTLSFWLKDLDISYSLIGAFSLVKIPYSLKWAWSPLIDNIKIPYLYKMGRRRSWAVLIQTLLFLSLTAMAFTHPEKHTLHMAMYAFIASFLSASQDIILDAYRVESFENEPEKQASGVAIYVLGYRLGLIFSGAGAIYLASVISWNEVYLVMACGLLVGFIAVLLASEPQKYSYKKYEFKLKDSVAFFKNSIVNPFKDFAKRRYWYWILLFIFTYRLSNAYFAPMSFPFYVDLGFSKAEIASVIKIYGMIAAILGGLTGGLIVMKIGMKNSLLLFGITQCLTTFLFAVQASYGHNMPLFITIITLENFSSGLATTALVAYISSLCNKLYTATQYALLSSVISLSRDIFASTSGILAQYVSWKIFFIFSGFLSLPSLIIVWFCIKKDK